MPETTWGTTPGSTALQALRITSESLGFNIENITSNELDYSRMVGDLIQTGAENSGGIDFELSYGTFDDLLEGAMMSDWVGVAGGATGTITSGTAGSNLEFTLNGTSNLIVLGSGVTHSIIAGQWIRLLNSTADDGYHYVTTVSGATLTVSTDLTGGEVLGESDAAVIKGFRLRNGSTKKHYTIERYHADMTPALYFQFQGMMVNQMSLNAAANAILTGNMSFIGKGLRNSIVATSSCGTSTTAANDNNVMNAVSNVANIMEGSTLTAMSGVYIQSLDFTLNNNLRGNAAIGTLGNTSVSLGRCEVNGSMNVYFTNKNLYDKYLAGTESGLSFRVSELATATHNSYVFTFPRVKFASDTVNAGGINTDVIENFTWQALRHATQSCLINIDRFPTD
jgi:hypothetical protein